MDPNESRPGCRALALRGGSQSVALQDIADGLIADLVAQIGQRPRNSVITPVTILPRHANDQLLNLSLDPRPARFAIACPKNRSQRHPATLRRERTTHRLFYSSNFLTKRDRGALSRVGRGA